MTVNLYCNSRDTDGNPIISPTFENTAGFRPCWKTYKYVAIAGATSFWDEVVTDEKLFRGGWYELLDTNAVVGDYVEFSVIDKNDVLGLFTGLGLTVGEDILELRKYVETEYVNPNYHGRNDFKGNSTFPVIVDLFARFSYVSVGSNNVTFKVGTFNYV